MKCIDAIYNTLSDKYIQYKKANKIKILKLLEVAKQMDKKI